MTDTAQHASQQLAPHLEADIRHRHAHATPGPWLRDGNAPNGGEILMSVSSNGIRQVGSFDAGTGPEAEANMRFVAAARVDVSRLLAEVDRLRAALASGRAVLDGDDLLLGCPDCVCADCGGTLGQHTPGGVCSCGCNPACDRFCFDPQLDQIAAAVEPMLDTPLAEAVAHTAWHALNAPSA